MKLLKKADQDVDVASFIDDRFARGAAKQAGLDYDARLKDYAPLPLRANDATSGRPITDFGRVAQIWPKGTDKVLSYASPEGAFAALATLEKSDGAARVVYVQDLESGIELFADQAWYVRDDEKRLGGRAAAGCPPSLTWRQPIGCRQP